MDRTITIGRNESANSRRHMAVMLFAASVFVSAALLFSIQPIVAKLLLPLLGGAPAVWNTCMLFFQTTLLAGYIYAFVVTRLKVRVQLAVHVLMLVVALVSLPIRLTPFWTNSVPVSDNPSFWLLGCLLVLIGLPFFIISANGPLLQHWFSESALDSEVNAYVLYSVSNAGSLLALLLYPFLVERYLSLQMQTQLWSDFYVLLVLVVGACAALLWRSTAVHQSVKTNVEPDDAEKLENKPIGKERLQWVALAFVPSTLMYGVTSYISTDIAAVPLIWVVPLALYLLTLVVAFARRQPISLRIARAILKLSTIGILLIYLTGLFSRASFLIPIHLFYFVLVAFVFHAELANRKPAAKYLADFYIWLCVGGALGGVFNSLIAPAVFRSIVEYPLAIVLACLLLPAGTAEKKTEWSWANFGLPACMFLLTVALGFSVHQFIPIHLNGMLVAILIPLAISYFLHERSFSFGLAVAAVVVGAGVLLNVNDGVMLASRNFFGIIRVVERDNTRSLMHGITDHGRQSTDPRKRCEPISYYHREGPLGAIFTSFEGRTNETNVAMIGLGTGTATAYSRRNHRWTFYEINPAVISIARNPQYFTYLSECAQAPVDIVVGDARLKLKDAPDAHYNLIVVDAFSSDAIPVHLLTQQALDLYVAKLAPGGVLAFHISNRYLDLAPVIADLANSRGLDSIALDYLRSNDMSKAPSQWIVLASNSYEFASLTKLPYARSLTRGTERRVWTDDYSDVLSAFIWRRPR